LTLKATEHAANYRKIDGYSKLFEENGEPKTFTYEEECGKMEVRVMLRFWNKDLRGGAKNAYLIYYVADFQTKLAEEVSRLLSSTFLRASLITSIQLTKF
jgi:hypothetical protein